MTPKPCISALTSVHFWMVRSKWYLDSSIYQHGGISIKKLLSAPSKTSVYQFWAKSKLFSSFSPPYWIHHFGFRKFNSKIITIDLEIPCTQILSKMLPLNLSQPLWILKASSKIAIRDLKNRCIPIFSQI